MWIPSEKHNSPGTRGEQLIPLRVQEHVLTQVWGSHTFSSPHSIFISNLNSWLDYNASDPGAAWKAYFMSHKVHDTDSSTTETIWMFSRTNNKKKTQTQVETIITY